MPGMTVLPQFQGDYYHLQNQQALAQALMQQSFQPQNTQAVGSGQYSVVPKYSAVGGLAQLGQALIAAKMQNQVAQGYQTLGQNQWSALTGSPPTQQSAPQQAATDDNSSGPGVTSSPVPTPGQPTPQALASALGGAGSPAQAPQQGGGLLSPGGPLNPNGIPTTAAAMMYMTPEGQKELFKSTAAAYAPTAATMQARQGGFDPSQANRAQFQKDSYVAPTTGTGIMRNPFTQQPVAFNPAIPDGATPLFDASGNVAKVQPIQGAQGVMQGNAAATAAGGAQFKPVQVYNPQTQQMEFSNEAQVTNPSAPAPVRNNNPGAMMPGGKLAQYPDMQTGLTALDNNLQSYGKQGVNTVAGVISKWAPPNENDTQAYIKDVSQRLGIPANQKIDLTNPLQRQALSTAIALHENGPSGVFGRGQAAPAASAPMGAQVNAEKGAGNLQDELSKKFTTLSAANSEAQNTTSYLQNIKDLAARAAVGPQSDRLNYVNGLLSLAGSEKATDAVTANDLLNKYSGQITARLSANGMGTDAARSILQSAYPSAHMNKDAINEAADNLIGAQQMTQAKARLLTPLANARNPTDYNNAEMKFDQNADPRIFQYANIQDPTQRQAFAQKLIKQDPKIVQKIKNLEGMGAMQ
jgi:hypothetical protein